MFSLHVFRNSPLRPSALHNNWDNDDDVCKAPTIELTTFHKEKIVALKQQKEHQALIINNQVREKLQQEEREHHAYRYSLRLDDTRVCYTYCEIFTISEERPEFECNVHSVVRNEPLPREYEDIDENSYEPK